MPNKKPPKDRRFKKGQSGNPNGRPKGLSITALVREELHKVPEGQKQTAKDLLVKRIIKKAIADGDKQMIQLCWEYMDGKPHQTSDVRQVSEIEVKWNRKSKPKKDGKE